MFRIPARLFALLALLLLAACSAPATQPASAPAAVTPAPVAADAGDRDGLPRLGPPAAGQAVKVDSSCSTDADCTVKNVGNCCGFYPACVNVNSPTDPEGVKARCADQGTMSVCGFPAIDSCSCVQGKCQAARAKALLDEDL